MAVTDSPAMTRAPGAVTEKLSRRRIEEAEMLTTTTPAAPAAKSSATWLSVAPSTRSANRTSWLFSVEATKLIKAIMSEMLRRIGCDQTYRRPARTSPSKPLRPAAGGEGGSAALKLRRMRARDAAEATKLAASDR